MHLIYVDESGNTGNNLQEPLQPVFVLAALVVPETSWLPLETDLQAAIDRSFPAPRPRDFEVHANELFNSRGYFRQFPIQQRLDFCQAWMALARKHGLKVIHRAIAKKRYAGWLLETFGPGVVINPHVAAFALVAQVLNEYLRSLPGSPLGILISDENKDVMRDVEKSIRLLRGGSGRVAAEPDRREGVFHRFRAEPAPPVVRPQRLLRAANGGAEGGRAGQTPGPELHPVGQTDPPPRRRTVD